jgi:hypothetical protein
MHQTHFNFKLKKLIVDNTLANSEASCPTKESYGEQNECWNYISDFLDCFETLMASDEEWQPASMLSLWVRFKERKRNKQRKMKR